MVMKGSVQPGHIPVNNYELIVIGLPKILFATIGGGEQETETVDLPDRTVASGGNVKAGEFPATMFEHHVVERDAMEAWRRAGIDPVDPLYKKVGTLIRRDIHGNVAATRTYLGLQVTKRKDPDMDMANEGDPAMIEWTLKFDDIR